MRTVADPKENYVFECSRLTADIELNFENKSYRLNPGESLRNYLNIKDKEISLDHEICKCIDQKDYAELAEIIAENSSQKTYSKIVSFDHPDASKHQLVCTFRLKSKVLDSCIFELEARDISAHQRTCQKLIEDNCLLSTILNSSNDLIVISDNQGNIIFTNEQFRSYFPEQISLSGLNILEFADDISKSFLKKHFESRSADNNLNSNGQLRFVNYNSQGFLINFSMSAIVSGSDKFELFIGQDQTREQFTYHALEIQREIGRELARKTEINKAAQFVLNEICQISGIDKSSLIMFNRETEELQTWYSRSFPSNFKRSYDAVRILEKSNSLPTGCAIATFTFDEFEPLFNINTIGTEFQSISLLPIKNIDSYSAVLLLASATHVNLPDYLRNAIISINNMLCEGMARIISEEARKDAESIFRTFMDNLPSAAFLRDENKNLLYTNKIMRNILDKILEEQQIPAGIIPPVLANTFFDFEIDYFKNSNTLNEEFALLLEDKQHSYDALKFPITSAKGEALFGAIISDITFKKEVEKELKHSEERYRSIVSSLPDIVLKVSNKAIVLDSIIPDSTQSFVDKENILGKNLISTGLDRDHCLNIINLIITSIEDNFEGHYQFEQLINSEIIHYEVNIVPNHNKEAILYFRDISQRISMKKDLQDQKNRFRTIFETSPDSIIITRSEDNKIIDANQSMCEVIGLNYEDIIGQHVDNLDLWHNEVEKQCFRDKMEHDGKILNYEAQFKTHKGDIVNTLVAARKIRIDNENCIISIVRNINDFKNAQEALLKSEQKYRQLIENQGEGVCIADTSEVITFANPAAEKIFGVETGQLIGRSFGEFTGERSFSSMQKRAQKRKKGISETYELIITRPDRSKATLLITASSQYNKTGQFIGSFGVLRDISMIKSAQKALLESEKKYRQLFELESDALFVVDSKTGRILEANNAAIEMYGYSKEDFAKMEIYQLTGDCREYSDALKMDGISIDKCIQVRKDNTFFPAEITLRHFRRNKRKVHISAVRDITYRMHAEEERMQLEIQLRQAQKLEAVGRLAGGIAHDFNNLLTAILGHTQLMQLQISPEDPIYKETEEILSVSQRATRLIQQLLTFSRKQVISPKVVDLNQIISDMERMLQRIIGDDVILAASQENDLKKIYMDVTQVEQIIINLAVNARDAMPEGGNLDLETSNVIIDENTKLLNPEISSGEYVCLAISDSGIGMDKRTIEKIFEPFFTTKEEGKGTGLGLSTAYGIVKQNGGHIEVYSELSIGTTFNIYLPASTETEENEENGTSSQLNPYGNETILVAENDDLVRDLSVRALEQFGYKVIEAENGMEAFQIINSGKDKIDIVLTDVVMPLLNGPELIDKIREAGKLLKVIYMSGYTDQAMVSQDILQKTDTFLKKPFSPMEMVNKVRKVLNVSEN